jgi:hypothetical protein
VRIVRVVGEKINNGRKNRLFIRPIVLYASVYSSVLLEKTPTTAGVDYQRV